MHKQHHNIILPFEDIQQYNKKLLQEFPFIHYNLPNGIDNIFDAAVQSVSLTELDYNNYLETCVDFINCLIDEEDINSTTDNGFSSAAAELYSPSFYDFLLKIFFSIKNILKDILIAPDFIIVNKTYLTNRKCLYIEVDLYDQQITKIHRNKYS